MFNILSKNPKFTFHEYDRTKINITVLHTLKKLDLNGNLIKDKKRYKLEPCDPDKHAAVNDNVTKDFIKASAPNTLYCIP